jgi:hypothetical protein|tara:strand:+ start:7222 stop:7857 length:636 start_codon:yes stop_codon:yes gene_type:complete
MGLFSELEDERRSKRPTTSKVAQGVAVKEDMILQASELILLVRQVVDLNQIDAKSRKLWKNNRARLKDAKWQLHNSLGNVSESIFTNQIGMCLEGMAKNIRQSQPNGDWRISEYEADIKKDAGGDECVILVVKWIDASDQEDLQYHNGVPAMNVNIKNGGLSKEALEAITSKSESSSDEELKSLLKGLIGVMSQNASVPTVQNEDTTNKKI